jgi:hypothetical protein
VKKKTTEPTEQITKPTFEDRMAVRLLVRAREDFQAQRKRMDNRIGRKADGEDQDVPERMIRQSDLGDFIAIADTAKEQEVLIEKRLKQVLKRFPIYNEWLLNVKGVGTIAAATIIAEFNIEVATTVSKLWQYAGLNPSTVLGKKRVKTDSPKSYEPKRGTVIKRGEDYVLVQTDEPIRGDKLTEGFVSPFNTRLRTALCGVLADGFIKCQAPYALEHYYPYKERLAQSDKMTTEVQKGGKAIQVAWKDAKPAHRDRAAKRFMIKRFLADLYVAWRTMEGLEVRPPYQEQYLGHVHQ